MRISLLLAVVYDKEVIHIWELLDNRHMPKLGVKLSTHI